MRVEISRTSTAEEMRKAGKVTHSEEWKREVERLRQEFWRIWERDSSR